jgi:cell division protein FtsI (penicillin-binding protein 3)
MFNHQLRVKIISTFFLLLFMTLIGRVIYLMIINQSFLVQQGDARQIRKVKLPAYRGIIFDRNNIPLAISSPVQSLWIDPEHFFAEAEELHQLAKTIGTTPEKIIKKIQRYQNKHYMYLARNLSPDIVAKLKQLPIYGLHVDQSFKRFYPQGETIAQLIGYTNVDEIGIEGIEKMYHSWLEGQPGIKRFVKDRDGHIIAEVGEQRAAEPGHNLTLTIDQRIQSLAYRALEQTVQTYAAKAGTVVVMDSQNGDLLAIANYPSYNPNNRGQYIGEHFRQRAFTDLFEPGSVIKPFSIASALNSGKFTVNTVIDTNPSYMMVKGHAIRDMRNYGKISVAEIIQHSSNVGVTKMVLANNAEHLIDLFKRVGFAQRSYTGYPGEAEGDLPRPEHINPFVLATLGFGYHVSVTPIQLTQAYSIFANEGQLRPVNLIYQNENRQQPIQAVDKEVANQLLQVMEGVISAQGTGSLARVPGYRVAGKTGTSRVADERGYNAEKHIGSFVGIAPVSNPKLIVAVVIYEPTRGSYYGGKVAAPLFAKVMGGALHVLEIKPDKIG